MKKCPFCAEEIQEAAKVCKHCGRDLINQDTAQKVQIVEPKKKTGCVTWLAAGFFLLVLLVMLRACFDTPSAPATSTPTTPPSTTTTPAEPTERSGNFKGSQVRATRDGAQWTIVINPYLPADDETIIGVSRYVLNDLLSVNMKNVGAPRIAGQFLRFNTGEGSFDVLIAREKETEGLIGLGIVKR